MSEELGKIERPPAEGFQEARKLYLVPLVFVHVEAAPGLAERVNKYWDQVEAQIGNLETKLGAVKKVYHELIPVGGEEGAKAIKALNEGSYRIAGARLERGAELQPLEEAETLAEFMDWGRCLAVGLQSHKVFATVYESYVEAQKRRNEYASKQIDSSLKEGETGLLLMTEGNRVQFPSDIQVFYVAPPALDEITRWHREHAQSPEKGP